MLRHRTFLSSIRLVQTGSFIGLLFWYDVVINKKEAIKMVALIIIGIIFYIPLAVIFGLADKYK